MSALSKYNYYARSAITLLTRFEHPGQIAGIFLGRPGALPAEVGLRREGWRFLVREPMDVWVIKETCIDGDYVRDTSLKDNWQVVDIGAGLGDFSIYAGAHCRNGTVHAYEPLGGSCELLRQNLALNQASNVKVFCEATGATGRVLAAPGQDGPAVSTAFAPTDQDNGIETASLERILDRLLGGRCDFLKIDCEGCEYDLLMDSDPGALLRVQRISAETHDLADGHTAADLAHFLENYGFRVRRRPNPVHDHLGFLYAERV
jgi:FkbM family methyltransferase